MSKILIVDDNLETRLLLKDFLEDHNYVVYEAANGHEGLVLERRHHPDLAIIDVVMPKKGGVETAKEIKKIDSETTIFMISGKTLSGSTEKLLDKVRKFGASRTFTKPLDLPKLLEEIEAFIGTPEKIEEQQNSDEETGDKAFIDPKFIWIAGIILAFIAGYILALLTV